MDTLIDLINSFAARDKIAITYKSDYRQFTYPYTRFYTYILKTAAYLRAKG